MTTQGATPLGDNYQARLRHFSFNVTKDKSGTDSAQVPANPFILTVYRQGATVQGGGGTESGGAGTIEVYSPGQIKVNDVIISDADDSLSATVSVVNSNQIDFVSASAGFSWANPDRIIPTNNLLSLWTNDHAEDTELANPLTVTNARGFGEVYAEPRVVDYKLSGSGITTRYVADYYAADNTSFVLKIEDYPGSNLGAKLLAALNDLDETVGGIVDCRGMIGGQQITADPFASVTWPFLVILGPGTITTTEELTAFAEDGQHIIGAGAGLTTVQAVSGFTTSSGCVFSMGDATATKDISLRNLTVDCNNISNSTGVKVEGGQEGTFLHNVHVKNAAKYGLQIQGVTSVTHANTTKFFNGKDIVLETNAASSIACYVDANVGSGCSIDGVHMASGTPADTGLQKNTTVGFRVANVTGTGWNKAGTAIGLIDIKADGGMIVENASGDSTITTIINVATGVDEYSLRGIVLNGSTNALVETDRSMTITVSIQEYSSGHQFRNDVLVAAETTPTYEQTVPAGGTATDVVYLFQEDTTAKFGYQKDGAMIADLKLTKFLNLGNQAANQLIIDDPGGAVVATGAFHTIRGNVDDVADDLQTITGGSLGDILVIAPDTGDAITCTNAGGTSPQLLLTSDFAMSSVNDRLVLQSNGTDWVEVARAGGFINFGSAADLTMTSGAITITKSNHAIGTNTGGDNLTTINGGAVDGNILYLRSTYTGSTTTVVETGNIVASAASAVEMTQTGGIPDNVLAFIYDATAAKWILASRHPGT